MNSMKFLVCVIHLWNIVLTDKRTDGPTKLSTEAPIPELKNKVNIEVVTNIICYTTPHRHYSLNKPPHKLNNTYQTTKKKTAQLQRRTWKLII